MSKVAVAASLIACLAFVPAAHAEPTVDCVVGVVMDDPVPAYPGQLAACSSNIHYFDTLIAYTMCYVDAVFNSGVNGIVDCAT